MHISEKFTNNATKLRILALTQKLDRIFNNQIEPEQIASIHKMMHDYAILTGKQYTKKKEDNTII
ncbi:MAG: hypothetical protein IKU15_00320 [Clostridia bacterium]|nr:hypothetical protein [Clostridia bacterium]MBR4889746.1 hypothetical protein [Clostridia bacterium]